MRDPRVGSFVSVNDVMWSVVTFHYAEIYVSSLDRRMTLMKSEALLEVLNSAAGFFRSELAKGTRCARRPTAVSLRQLEEGPRMEKLDQ